MLYTAREARFYPGEGVMNVKELADALPGTDIAIELPNLSQIAKIGAKEHARMCLLKAKELLG